MGIRKKSFATLSLVAGLNEEVLSVPVACMCIVK